MKKQNKLLWLAALGSVALTTVVCEVPLLGNAFGFTHVGFMEYGMAVLLGFAIIPIVEIVKLVQRKVEKKK